MRVVPEARAQLRWEQLGFDIPTGATGEIRVTCPRCSAQRRKPSERCCAVNLDKGAFYCHHCGARGSLDKGLQDSGNPNAWKASDWAVPPMLPTTAIPTKVYAWFAKRGIPKTVVDRNQIAYGDAYMPQSESWVPCVQFPYRLAGKVVNVKFRELRKKQFRQIAGAMKVPFGVDDLADADEIIWVEGEMDKLAVEAAGYKACVSVPDGAPPPGAKNYATKFAFLEPVWETLEGKTHILAVDADEPGQCLEAELSRRLGREHCRRVRWPDGVKDANEMLVTHGAAELARVIQEAEEYPIAGLYRVMHFWEDTQKLWEDGLPGGVSTGWVAMDPYYTVRLGEWTLVTGIPGHGKSSWVDALCVHLASKHGWPMAIFSPENQPIQAHIAKFCEIYLNQPFRKGPTQRMDLEAAHRAMQWLHEHFTFLLPPETELTIDHILEKARVAVRRHGIRGLVIDPWNELDHSRPGNYSETEYISECLTKVRRFARNMQIHIWLVAHPAKLMRDKDGNRPVPTPYDVSGSAHWYNKADNCITIYRDTKEGQNVQIHVQKIRFREVGKPGLVEMKFDRVTGRYFSF